MALKLTIETKYGLTLTDAHVRIIEATYRKKGEVATAEFTVGIFASKALADQGLPPLETRTYFVAEPDPQLSAGVRASLEAVMLATSEYEDAEHVSD